MAREKLTTNPELSAERAALLHWTAGLGAVTAEALALRWQISAGSARARLVAAERGGVLARHRPLADRPALYTITRSGLRAIRERGLDPAQVSAAGATHLIECAWVAASLELGYPDHRVTGERDLRRAERECGRALASAECRVHSGGENQARTPLHRPDLVLWPRDRQTGLPIAVEVELTVKAPQRLRAICRAWARARCVAGVIYLVTADVERALASAVEQVRADRRIAIVSLEALARERPVSSDA